MSDKPSIHGKIINFVMEGRDTVVPGTPVPEVDEGSLTELTRRVVNANAEIQGGGMTWGVITDENRQQWREYVRPHFVELSEILNS